MNTFSIARDIAAEALIEELNHVNRNFVQNPGMFAGSTTDDFSEHAVLVGRLLIGIQGTNPSYILQGPMPVELSEFKTFTVELLDHSNRRGRRMDFAPEGGQALQLQHEVRHEKITLQPVGEYNAISLNLLPKAEGRVALARMLMMMAKTFYEVTLPAFAFDAIMRHCMTNKTMVQVVRREDYIAAVNLFIEGYAAANKTEMGFATTVKLLKQEIIRKNRDATPSYIICPKDKVDVILQNSARYGSYSGTGEMGAKLALGQLDITIDGVKVGMSPEGSDGWEIEITTGTYVPIIKRVGGPAQGYPSVKAYNGATGAMESRSLADAFKYCGMFEQGPQGERPVNNDIPVGPALVDATQWRLTTAAFYGIGTPNDSKNVSPFLIKGAAGNWDIGQGVNVARTMAQWIDGAAPWPGLSALSFNALYRQKMSPAVMVCDGLGTVYQSKGILCQAPNPARFMQEIGFRAECGAIVKDPERIAMAPYCFYAGGVRGSDSKPIKDKFYYKNHNWEYNDAKGSVFYVCFPATAEGMPSWPEDKPFIHLTGRTPFDAEDGEMEYPGAASAAEYWGWKEIEQRPDVADPKLHIAPFCCLGSYSYTLADGHEVHVNGMSHHGSKEDINGKIVRRYGMSTV